MRRLVFGVAVLGILAGCSSSSDGGDAGTPIPPFDGAIQDSATTDAPSGDSGTVDSASDAPATDDTAIPPPPSSIPVRACTTDFSFPLGQAGHAVTIIGEWNSFKPQTMDDPLGTGTYKTELTIPAGSYGYKFVVDGNDYRLDPSTRYARFVGGVENSRVDVPDCTAPLLQIVSTSATADGTVDLEVQYVDGADAKGPDGESLAATMQKQPLTGGAVTFDTKTGRIHVHASGLAPTKYTFGLAIADSTGKAADPLTIPMWVEAEPFDWQDGPLYFVFTDRFRNGDPSNDAPVSGVDKRANYQGGDYKGVLAALKEGYFDQLGVRSIWLSPANDNTNNPGIGTGNYLYTGYHGYWPIAPRTVEEHWGTLADLQAITAEAHKHGIRIILDLVQNQLHQEHTYYQQHKSDGWFNGDGSCVCGGPNCDWDTYALVCWFATYLPDVNWTDMDAVEAMIGDAMYWVDAADVDGFRVDAVKHMQDIASTTLRIRLHDKFEGGNARYYLVGETFVGGDGRPLINQFIGPQALWGQFDFPLYWQIDSTFSGNAGVMQDLENVVAAGESQYVPGAVMSPFLGNQDVARFLSRAAGMVDSDTTTQAWTNPPAAPNADAPYDQTFLAFTFLLTQRGVPLVYYGDEIGMPGTSDPDNRRMMRFGTDLSTREQHLFDRVKIVAKARGTLPGLRRGARRPLYTDGDGYVFARGASIDTVIVALNRGQTSRSVHVAIPADLGVPDGTVLKDLLGGPSVTVAAGAIDVPLTPRGASLFTR